MKTLRIPKSSLCKYICNPYFLHEFFFLWVKSTSTYMAREKLKNRARNAHSSLSISFCSSSVCKSAWSRYKKGLRGGCRCVISKRLLEWSSCKNSVFNRIETRLGGKEAFPINTMRKGRLGFSWWSRVYSKMFSVHKLQQI